MAYWLVNYGDGSTTGYYAVTPWSATTAKIVGSLVRQLAVPANGNERCFICSLAGNTGAAEPAWNLTPATRTIDGTANWIECTGQPFANQYGNTVVPWLTTLGAITVGTVTRGRAVNTSGIFICTTAGTVGAIEPTWNVTTAGQTTVDGTATWTYLGLYTVIGSAYSAPIARLATALNTYVVPNDAILVGDNHAETQAAPMTLSLTTPSCRIYCMDHTFSAPAGSRMRTTATITNTGNNLMNISGRGYINGLNFIITGNAAINLQTVVGNNFGTLVFENCTLFGSGNLIMGVANTGSGFVIFNNTSTKFAAVSTRMFVTAVTFIWRNSLAFLPGNNIGTAGGSISTQYGGNVLCEGVDFSNCVNSVVNATANAGRVQLIGCVYPTAIANPIQTPIANNWYIDTMQSDAGSSLYRTERYRANGIQLTETTIVRAGGATDGITPISWNINTGPAGLLTNTGLGRPFCSMPLAIWNTIIGVPRTATIETITDGVILNNACAWIEAVYYGTAGSTLASFASAQAASMMDTPVNWPNSAAGWNTTGISSPIRQRLSVTFTPQAVGFVTINILMAPTTGGTVGYTAYVDPKVSIN